MFITPFVTRRIHATMQELTLRQAIDLCQIPAHLNELGTSRALEAIVAESNLPLKDWTVQERIAALGHYITAQEQGDWRLTEDAMFSDYLIEQDYPAEPYRFDDLEIVPLTGEYAEAVERAQNSQTGDWIMSAMAACIRTPDDAWDGTADEFVQTNREQLFRLPESEFAHLLHHFEAAQQHLAHDVEIGFDADGIVLKGGAGLSPVRFRFIEIVSEAVQELWRSVDEPSASHFHTAGLGLGDGVELACE